MSEQFTISDPQAAGKSRHIDMESLLDMKIADIIRVFHAQGKRLKIKIEPREEVAK